MTEIPLPERAIDIRGENFGYLTAEYPIEVLDGSVVWFCKCVCGGAATRTASYLRYAGAVGVQSSCLSCLRRRSAERGRNRFDAWVELWERTQCLYSAAWDKREQERLSRFISEELEITPDAEEIETLEYTRDGCGFQTEMKCDSCSSLQMSTFIDEDGFGWKCESCSIVDSRIHGCLKCARVVCHLCVKKEYHRAPEGGMTLREVGEIFGVGGERIRQIEAKALRKLRRLWRAKHLIPFISSELSKSELRRIRTAVRTGG